MIMVDEAYYSKEDLTNKFSEYSKDSYLSKSEGKIISICVGDAFILISLILFLREVGASVLLFHSETPYQSVVNKSIEAGSSFIISGSPIVIRRLSEKSTVIENPSIMQFTSGTTGKPKVIYRDWNSIDDEIENYCKFIYDGKTYKQPIILVPVHHSFGLISGVLSAIHVGAEPRIVMNKNPKYAIHLIQNIKKSTIFSIPFSLNLLLSFRQEELRLDQVVSAASPFTPKLLKQLKERSNLIWNQYGCSEIGCISLKQNPNNSNEVGNLLPHLTVNLNENVSDEIVVQYKNQLIYTNDLGVLDSNGSLQLLSRLDDVINVSGFKVIPSEVEHVLMQLEGISEAVVFRKKHQIWGETVAALVVAIDSVTNMEIVEYCSEYLAKYKIPTHIYYVREIPRAATGKIVRKLIELEYDEKDAMI